MHRNKQIAIILPDTLQSIGLQSLLIDYFPPVEVGYFPTFAAFSNEKSSAAAGDPFDYYFTRPETFLLNADFFLPRKNKTVLLIKDTEASGNPAAVLSLTTLSPQETVIEQLQQIFASENSAGTAGNGEGNKELSSREIDVLKLIVKGITNKEIADKLNISLNTVLTHRKNITAKLGIKTVSGLTFYAIMNGIISGDDIEL